jgi:predicted nucleic acid-binding protein
VSVFVVDASLVLKWFVPEIHFEAAARWLSASHDYVAPDLLFPEVGNTVWKKVRRGELSVADGRRLASAMAGIAVEAVAMSGLIGDAVALAIATDITVYDATYVTLAVRLDTQVVTGDDRLVARLAGHTMLAPHVRRIQDFAD